MIVVWDVQNEYDLKVEAALCFNKGIINLVAVIRGFNFHYYLVLQFSFNSKTEKKFLKPVRFENHTHS